MHVICFLRFSFNARWPTHCVRFVLCRQDSRSIQQLNYIVVKNGRWTAQRCMSIGTWRNDFVRATKTQRRNPQLARASDVKLSSCVETNIDARARTDVKTKRENKSDQQFYADWMRTIGELLLVAILECSLTSTSCSFSFLFGVKYVWQLTYTKYMWSDATC